MYDNNLGRKFNILHKLLVVNQMTAMKNALARRALIYLNPNFAGLINSCDRGHCHDLGHVVYHCHLSSGYGIFRHDCRG
jgi:hypothetical protein